MQLGDRQQREKEFWEKEFSPDMYTGKPETTYAAWKAANPLVQTALEWLEPIAGKRILVCGVGGREATTFARAGAEVYGFDISEKMTQAIEAFAERLNLADRIKVQAMPFEVLQYLDSYFDIAYGSAILHHIDLEQGASELRRVLKPGGRASFIEPLGTNPFLTFARRHLPYRGKHRTPDESPLVYKEIELFIKDFARSEYREFTLLAMLHRRVLTSRSFLRRARAWDRVLLKRFPQLGRLCSQVWIGVEKSR
jgi:SAM-dependent methyltransferase